MEMKNWSRLASVEGCKYIPESVVSGQQSGVIIGRIGPIRPITMPIRTAVVGVGSLGRQHARLHAALAAEGLAEFVCVVDLNEQTAKSVGEERHVGCLTDWHEVVGKVDAVSLAVPTEVHCEIACGLLKSGVH